MISKRMVPKGPFRTVFSTGSNSVLFYYSVVNLLRIVIHYSKNSKSVQNIVIHYIFSSESLRVLYSLRVLNSLRVLFLVCRGSLGTWHRRTVANAGLSYHNIRVAPVRFGSVTVWGWNGSSPCPSFPWCFCAPWCFSSREFPGKKKAHEHKLFCPVGLGTTPGLPRDFTGLVPGTNPVKTRGKPGFSPYFTQWKPDFTGFVLGTIPGTKGGTESLCEKNLCAFFAR